MRIAPALLALACLIAPLNSRADDPSPAPEKKLTKAQQKYDVDNDGKLSDEEKAKAKTDAKERRAERQKEILAKYDANGNGKLDADERAKQKADEDAAKAARKADREAKQAAKDSESK